MEGVAIRRSLAPYCVSDLLVQIGLSKPYAERSCGDSNNNPARPETKEGNRRKAIASQLERAKELDLIGDLSRDQYDARFSTDTSFVDDASGDIMFKTADLEWCQPVFVLDLPNSRSRREGLTGKPRACCWLGLV